MVLFEIKEKIEKIREHGSPVHLQRLEEYGNKLRKKYKQIQRLKKEICKKEVRRVESFKKIDNIGIVKRHLQIMKLRHEIASLNKRIESIFKNYYNFGYNGGERY